LGWKKKKGTDKSRKFWKIGLKGEELQSTGEKVILDTTRDRAERKREGSLGERTRDWPKMVPRTEREQKNSIEGRRWQGKSGNMVSTISGGG